MRLVETPQCNVHRITHNAVRIVCEWSPPLLAQGQLTWQGAGMAGLDNAGKSTLLHKLCSNEVRAFVPTTKAHAKTFSLGSITFTAWDLGGHEQVCVSTHTTFCHSRARARLFFHMYMRVHTHTEKCTRTHTHTHTHTHYTHTHNTHTHIHTHVCVSAPPIFPQPEAHQAALHRTALFL